jgi:hypothetical protein
VTTDRVSDSGEQGASAKSLNLTEALFGPHIDQCWVAQSDSWDGCFYSREVVAAFSPDRRHHFSCALMKPGAKARDKASFDGAILFVLDDVGTVAPPGALSITGSSVAMDAVETFAPESGWVVETSKGNHQVGWRIEVEHDIDRWEHFLRSMGQHPVFGLGIHDAVHYFRSETGSGKKEKGAFRTRLVKPFTGMVWKLDDLAAAFGIDMSPETVAASARASSSNSRTAGTSTCSIETMQAILDAIVNDLSRQDWTGVCHAIQNTLGEDGRDLWVEWSETYKGAHGETAKPGEAERVWDTLPPEHENDLYSLIEIIGRRHGRGSDVLTDIQNMLARDPAGGGFTAVNEEETQGGAKEAKVDLKFRALLKEIARTQPVPDHHKPNGKGHDEHWFPTGGGLLDIGTLVAGALPVAPPVIYEPFVRGVLTVVGGAPSIGKSNLMLDQSLAVVADRGDLLRNGCKLQFAGDVVFVSNEDGLSVLQRRATAWASHHKIDLTKTPYKLVPVRTSLFSKDAKETWHADCLPLLERVLEHGRGGRRIAMIVVDTLATSVLGVNENQTVDMSPAMKLFSELAVALWCSVAFLHHTTKEAWARGSADTTLRSIATIRGSGGITGTYTRGATLIVAPNKKELDEHPDWANRDVVVEFMAKANDGPENYVAGYYERKLIDVEQVSAVDPLVREFRKEPVLVPFQPMLFGNDTVLLDGYETTLRAHKNEIRVVEKLGPNGSPDAVQVILGVSNSVAKTIIDGLVGAKRAKIGERKDKKYREYQVLEFEPNPPTPQDTKTE